MTLADQLADIKAKRELVCGVLGTDEPSSFIDPKTRTIVGYRASARIARGCTLLLSRFSASKNIASNHLLFLSMDDESVLDRDGLRSSNPRSAGCRRKLRVKF